MKAHTASCFQTIANGEWSWRCSDYCQVQESQSSEQEVELEMPSRGKRWRRRQKRDALKEVQIIMAELQEKGEEQLLIVPTQAACPHCREANMDKLVWVSDTHVRCSACGKSYIVLETVVDALGIEHVSMGVETAATPADKDITKVEPDDFVHGY